MINRVILHCKIVNFYVAAHEAADILLHNTPFYIHNDTVVIDANSSARAYGIKKGDDVKTLRQRFNNVSEIKVDMDLYNNLSRAFYNICNKYSQLCLAQGQGECYLDLTSTAFRDFPDKIAMQIYKETLDTLSLPVSIGIGFNIFISDIALLNVRDQIFMHLTPDNFREYLWDMSINELPDMTPAVLKKLSDNGITCVKDIALASQDRLRRICGRGGAALWDCVCGFDSRTVSHIQPTPQNKVVGEGFSHKEAFDSNEDIRLLLLLLSDRISTRLQNSELQTHRIQLIIRDSNMRSFEYATNLCVATQNHVSIARQAYDLFKKSYKWNADITSVIIKATELTYYRTPLFTYKKSCTEDLAPIIFNGVTYCVNTQHRKQTLSEELKAFAEFFSCKSC